jgi:hypothetical protein
MLTKTIAGVGAVLAGFAVTGVALAAKPNSSLSLVMAGTSAASTTAPSGPSWGDQITFEVRTTQTDRPLVNVRCYQNSAFVYDAWQGFWSGYYTDPIFTLASGYWTGGAADCTARLAYLDNQGRERTLATIDFRVAA